MVYKLNLDKGGAGGHLMDLFHEEAQIARDADEYEKAQAFDLCVSAVNNIHHGLSLDELFPRLRTYLGGYVTAGWASDVEKAAFEDAVLIFEEYVLMVEARAGRKFG